MLKRWLTSIYSSSYSNINENMLTKILIYEITSYSSEKFANRIKFSEITNFIKPSDHVVDLFKKLEPKIPLMRDLKQYEILKLLLNFDTTNVRFYELLIEKFIVTSNSFLNIHQGNLINIIKHYLIFGSKSPEIVNALVKLYLDNNKSIGDIHFHSTYDFILLLNASNLDTSEVTLALRERIINSSNPSKALKYNFELFQKFYNYIFKFQEFYYPLVESYINSDNSNNYIQIKLFLHLMNINPCIENILLIKKCLEGNVIVSNQNLANIALKCFLLLDKESLESDIVKSFLQQLIQLAKNNQVDLIDKQEASELKILYLVDLRLNLNIFKLGDIIGTSKINTIQDDSIKNHYLNSELQKLINKKKLK